MPGVISNPLPSRTGVLYTKKREGEGSLRFHLPPQCLIREPPAQSAEKANGTSYDSKKVARFEAREGGGGGRGGGKSPCIACRRKETHFSSKKTVGFDKRWNCGKLPYCSLEEAGRKGVLPDLGLPGRAILFCP